MFFLHTIVTTTASDTGYARIMTDNLNLGGEFRTSALPSTREGLVVSDDELDRNWAKSECEARENHTDMIRWLLAQ